MKDVSGVSLVDESQSSGQTATTTDVRVTVRYMLSRFSTSKPVHTCAAIVAFAAAALIAPAATGAAEPNNDFVTATGPLTAGQVFKAGLETATDSDFQFFYLPDTTSVTVTTSNEAEKKGGAADRGRTIISGIFEARKGKPPLPLANTGVTVKPQAKDSVTISLLPGKYFIPVLHAETTSPPLGTVPFHLQIGPVGSTTDSHEIFEARCAAAKRELSRVKTSIKKSQKHLAKAKKNGAKSNKIVKLKLRLRTKRDKAHSVKKAEKFVCSIPA